MEPETIEKTNHCSMMKKTTSTAIICRVDMKHHINKHTVNRKVKCGNYHRPSIYHVEHAYKSHTCMNVTIAYTATKMKNHHKWAILAGWALIRIVQCASARWRWGDRERNTITKNNRHSPVHYDDRTPPVHSERLRWFFLSTSTVEASLEMREPAECLWNITSTNTER